MRRAAQVLLAFTIGCRTPVVTVPTTEPAIRGVLSAIDAHQMVLLGESHRSPAFHHFLRELVQTPAFADRVNDIVVEFGNTLYQPILDRYIAGDSVPHDSLQLVWRNTTQLLAWDSPLYEEFYATIRHVNAGRSADKRLRVLAGDPPIDWTQTHAASDIPRRYGDRDIETVRIIEREVLARSRKAIVIIGGTHIYRASPGDRSQPPVLERATLGDQLNRLHPGVAYSIESVFGDGNPTLARLVSERAFPGEMLRVTGTPLADTSSSVLFGTGMTRFRVVNGQRVPLVLTAADYPKLSRTLDALVYHGVENPRLLAAPSVYANDATYTAEIRRRITILAALYGGDFWTEELDAQLSAGKK
ncbi:MAG: ChaN family lipoprotein [bacterium]